MAQALLTGLFTSLLKSRKTKIIKGIYYDRFEKTTKPKLKVSKTISWGWVDSRALLWYVYRRT